MKPFVVAVTVAAMAFTTSLMSGFLLGSVVGAAILGVVAYFVAWAIQSLYRFLFRPRRRSRGFR